MSDNFGNFFSIGILSFFLPFFPLTPLQILLTDFLTDFPVFALATDYVLEREIRKPLYYRIKEMFSLLVALGLVSAIFIALALSLFRNQPPQFIQTIIFLQTTISGILVFYSVRTNDWFFKSKPSLFMNLTVLLGLILTLIVLIFPFRPWFGFAKLPLKVILFFFFFNLPFIFANDIVKKIVLQRFKNE
jgi:Mg2+-importing ATPase